MNDVLIKMIQYYLYSETCQRDHHSCHFSYTRCCTCTCREMITCTIKRPSIHALYQMVHRWPYYKQVSLCNYMDCNRNWKETSIECMYCGLQQHDYQWNVHVHSLISLIREGSTGHRGSLGGPSLYCIRVKALVY